MKKCTIILFICISYFNICFSQNKLNDSLKLELVTAKEDTNKINTLNALAWSLISSANYKTSLQFAEEALLLSEKLGFKKGKAYACQSLAYAYSNQFNLIEGSRHGYIALKIFEELGGKNQVASTLQLIGYNSFELGDTVGAFKNLFEALKIRKEINQKWGVAQTYNTIGKLYCAAGKYDEAFQQHFEAIKICTEIDFDGEGWSLPFAYQELGNVYEKFGDKEYARANKNIAISNYDSALNLYLKSLVAWKELDRIDGLADIYTSIGNIYRKLKKNKMGQEYFMKALFMGLELEDKEILKNSYYGLSTIDSIENNFKQALKHYKLFILYRDSIVNEKVLVTTEGHKMQYQFDKKEREIKILTTENKLKTTLASKQKLQKNFAFVGIATILLAGSYGFYRHRRRNKLQHKQAILNERLRISSELHDEVGATLSGIAMYSHLTKEQLKTGQITEIEKSLNVMQQSSVQMVDKLNDIVWLINPDQDSLQKLIERLEEYATEMGAIKNIEVKMNIAEKLVDSNFPVEYRRNIYLFCKEAINNAVKYSNATILELTVKEVNGQLEFSITDNGKGFDEVMVRRGNGLENMQKRADEIGAQLIVKSKQNEGSFVSILVKVS